jgi:D-aminoacyl-tRNA deacylase
MRAVVQRVLRAKVTVAGEVVAEIARGFLVLLGVESGDTADEALWLAQKISGLRVFDDPQGKMNLALADIGGEMLVVSQFTLLGDCQKGKRPSFDSAARLEVANLLYQDFVARVREQGIAVSTGQFQQHMLVELINDGPVTLLVEKKRNGP